MFEVDKKRIKSCVEHKDYSSAMEYSMLIIEKYKYEEREYLEKIIKYVKSGNYEKIDKMCEIKECNLFG